MTFSRLAISAFLLLTILGACSKNSSSTLSPTTVDSLKSEFQNISTQLDTTWAEMIKDDDDKLANLRRLLQEVEYSGNYNHLMLDSLKERIDQLENIRYNQQTMSDSNLINLYDSLTNQVLGEITIFATRLEQFEQYPLMGQLLQEAFEADDRVLGYRIAYDRSAKQYNSFLQSYQGNLQMIANQNDLTSKPLFELKN